MDFPTLSAVQSPQPFPTLGVHETFEIDASDSRCIVSSCVLLYCCFSHSLELFLSPSNYSYCDSGLVCLLTITLLPVPNFPEVQPLAYLCRTLPIGFTINPKASRCYSRTRPISDLRKQSHSWTSKPAQWRIPCSCFSSAFVAKKFADDTIQNKTVKKGSKGKLQEMVIRGQREKRQMETSFMFCSRVDRMVNRCKEWTGNKLISE